MYCTIFENFATDQKKCAKCNNNVGALPGNLHEAAILIQFLPDFASVSG